MRHARVFPALLAILLAVAVTAPAALTAQSGDYLTAVAEHFQVPASEVGILAQSRISAPEIPVVLFVSARAGASPDALLALRRGGRSWSEISSRYGLHAGTFHVDLGGAAPAGALAAAYEAYGSRDPSGWPAISLSDEAIVALVHIRFLSAYLSQPAGRVARVVATSGPGAPALTALRGGVPTPRD